MPKIERSYQQLWLVTEDGERHNVAELLATLVKPKAKPKKEEPVKETPADADSKV